MIKRIGLLIVTLLFTFTSWASLVDFVMSGPGVVGKKEQFRLTLTLNQRGGENLKLPNLGNFEVLMGPSTSSSSSIQIINGKTTQNFTYSYTFILRAKKTGKFTIRPASIEVNSKVYQSNSINIEVIEGSSNPTNSRNRVAPQQQQVTDQIKKEDLFVKVELNKTNVFKGQHVIATAKVYSRVNLSGFQDVKFPSYEGFWTQDIDLPQNIQLEREVYKGEIYNVGTLKKTILFPQQTGKIKIDPFEVECAIVQRRARRSIFDDFFDQGRTVIAKVASKPLTVTVKDIPAINNFSGGVGSFSIKGSLNKQTVKANDAVTLKIDISGNGNLKLIKPLKIDFPADFEVYDPKTANNLKTSENGVSGSVTFEHLFIPRHQGEYTIPEISFVYFNPVSARKISKKIGPFTINVEKGDDSQTATVVSSFSKEDVKFIGKDIRFIKQGNTRLIKTGHTFFGTLAFYLFYLISILGLAIIVLLYRQQAKRNANLVLVKHKKASKLARKHLKNASLQLKQNNREEFYEAVLKAFWGYLSDKLNLPMADLNRDKAVETLHANNVEEALVTEFISIVDKCEFARFAPAESEAQMSDLYIEAEQVMNKIDKQIR